MRTEDVALFLFVAVLIMNLDHISAFVFRLYAQSGRLEDQSVMLVVRIGVGRERKHVTATLPGKLTSPDVTNLSRLEEILQSRPIGNEASFVSRISRRRSARLARSTRGAGSASQPLQIGDLLHGPLNRVDDGRGRGGGCCGGLDGCSLHGGHDRGEGSSG